MSRWARSLPLPTPKVNFDRRAGPLTCQLYDSRWFTGGCSVKACSRGGEKIAMAQDSTPHVSAGAQGAQSYLLQSTSDPAVPLPTPHLMSHMVPRVGQVGMVCGQMRRPCGPNLAYRLEVRHPCCEGCLGFHLTVADLSELPSIDQN